MKVIFKTIYVCADSFQHILDELLSYHLLSDGASLIKMKGRQPSLDAAGSSFFVFSCILLYSLVLRGCTFPVLASLPFDLGEIGALVLVLAV